MQRSVHKDTWIRLRIKIAASFLSQREIKRLHNNLFGNFYTTGTHDYSAIYLLRQYFGSGSADNAFYLFVIVLKFAFLRRYLLINFFGKQELCARSLSAESICCGIGILKRNLINLKIADLSERDTGIVCTSIVCEKPETIITPVECRRQFIWKTGTTKNPTEFAESCGEFGEQDALVIPHVKRIRCVF